MIRSPVRSLLEKRAFDQRPPVDALYQYHVPFDDLLPGRQVESKLLALALARGRVGLVGASGTGKSSVASAAFGPLVQGVLPMTVQVHAEDSTVKTEQRSLAAHLARALSRTLTRSGDMSARQRSDLLSQTSPDEKVGRGQRSSSAEFGVSAGPVLAKLGTTVSPLVQVATSQRSTAEVVEALRDALGLVDEVGLVPVFVIDDSDSWFAGPYGANDEDVISRFFGHTLLLAQELPCSLVVCIHDHYLQLPSYPQGTGVLDQMLHVPHLPHHTALRDLVLGRGQRCGVEDTAAAFAGNGVFEFLFGYYNRGGAHSIRRVMLLLHNALSHAVEGGAPHVGLADLEAALGEMP